MYFLQYHHLISCSQSSFPAFSRINQTPNKSWSELYYAGKSLFQKNVLFYLSSLSWDTEHSFCMIPSPTLLFVFFCCCSSFFFLTKLSLLPYYSENVDHLVLHVNCINSFKNACFSDIYSLSLIRNSFKMINFIFLLVLLSFLWSPSLFSWKGAKCFE